MNYWQISGMSVSLGRITPIIEENKMNAIRGYSSPFNLGHRALKELFSGPVTVQEKIDGSQFSFGVKDSELLCRSRGQQIDLGAPGMFKLAVETARDLEIQGLLKEGWTYRGEFLMKPKHNTLAYERVPRGNVILFDIDRGDQDYLTMAMLVGAATVLDLELVPTWTINAAPSKPSMRQIDEWLDKDSILGGCKREGLVFKNYERYDPGSKVLMGKYVSEKFREKHGKDWKERNPSSKAFIEALTEKYATEARWAKAAQHLR
ncbi:unnamed protein product, partial [marine sediment metagenome]